MIFQPHRFSRTKAYWISFVETLKSLDHIILLPTYSAGERNNSYDSSFLYKEIKNKNKSMLKSIQNINKALTSLDFTESILILQGAGDVKKIINILDRK